MSVLASVLLYLLQFEKNYCDTAYDGTELVMAFMVHRHGDRTPVIKTLKYSNEPEKLEKLIEPYGYGQLTDAGLKRSYDLGKFIRRRYNEYLSPKYNHSEIYIRSTDSTRAKMTVLAAMAAVYPPNERRWLSELNWSPTPYTTVPIKNDPNMAVINCNTFRKFAQNTVHSMSSREITSQYKDLFEQLDRINIHMSDSPVAIFMLYDLYVAQMSMGLHLNSTLEKLLPKIREAAGTCWEILIGNEKYLPMLSGVLLKDFFEAAETTISGDFTQKIRILSAHDVNVYSFLSITGAKPRPSPIKYGSLYSLELRRVIRTGKYVILPVFLDSPEGTEQYLEIEGCGNVFCDYDKFKKITSKYVVDEDEWKELCNFDENMKIDISSVV